MPGKTRSALLVSYGNFKKVIAFTLRVSDVADGLLLKNVKKPSTFDDLKWKSILIAATTRMQTTIMALLESEEAKLIVGAALACSKAKKEVSPKKAETKIEANIKQKKRKRVSKQEEGDTRASYSICYLQAYG